MPDLEFNELERIREEAAQTLRALSESLRSGLERLGPDGLDLSAEDGSVSGEAAREIASGGLARDREREFVEGVARRAISEVVEDLPGAEIVQPRRSSALIGGSAAGGGGGDVRETLDEGDVSVSRIVQQLRTEHTDRSVSEVLNQAVGSAGGRGSLEALTAFSGGGGEVASDVTAENTRALRETAAALLTNTRAVSEGSSAYSQGIQSLLSGLSGFGGGAGGAGLPRSGLGLSPLATGLTRLFGRGGDDQEREFNEVKLPPSLSLELANARGPVSELRETVRGERDLARVVDERPLAARAPQVVVNVNAMDARSFQDRATDIANAVRDAMLHMHPLNDLIGEL